MPWDRRATSVTYAALLSLVGSTHAQTASTGPSSSQSPYVVGTLPGVDTTSIFTVGDSIGGYQMIGIPDGLGAFGPGNGSPFTLLMNHELGATSGAVRGHGQTGSFVSRWQINADLSVSSIRDHNTAASDAFEFAAGVYSNSPSPAQRWGRFCSGDLADVSAYSFGALGTTARIYLNGEEIGSEGRAYAHVASGPQINTTWHLPRLGRFSWENAIASPFPQAATLVLGTDDSTPGQIYLYLGAKTSSGNEIEKAGLTNGQLYGVRMAGTALETRSTPLSGRFDLFAFGDVTSTSGADLQTASVANGVTEFLRPEDGAWDTRTGFERDFYFVTTDRFNSPTQRGNSRLYRLRFDDIQNPLSGGTITMLVDGFTDGPNMMDNLCVDRLGRVLIQEDAGNVAALSKIWLYSTETDSLAQIAEHDPVRFLAPQPPPFTQDEESSGIIDVTDLLGEGWFLLDVQAHYGNGTTLVEGGQLLAMSVDPDIGSTCPADLAGTAGAGPDGSVDVSDLLYFLAQFELGTPGADLDNDGVGVGNKDGGVDISDLLFFLARFEGGC